MLLAVHGIAGGWDELAIAVVGLAVMWFAIKMAGRKRADDDDEDGDALDPEDAPAGATAIAEESRDPVRPPLG
jgi:hypothetical protein